jgi:cysteine synthase B
VAERIQPSPDGEVVATIVFVVSDGGWKYLSTGAWSGDLDQVAADVEGLIVF